MRLKLSLVALLAGLVLTGCGTTSPYLKGVDELESVWVKKTHATVVHGHAADNLAGLISIYVSATHASIQRLVIYRVPELAPSLTRADGWPFG